MFKLMAAAAAFCGLAASAAAEDYPTRPVRIVVGFTAGASADVTARVLAPKLSQALGQQFVVENRPGAGSNIAADIVAHAPKDGYTLFLCTIANAINATLPARLNFDFGKDFAPIALLASVPNILAVHPSLGVKTVQELVALVRAKPGQLSYGSSGVGTAVHLSGELFNVMAGAKMVHVPYPGSAQSVTDLIAGRVQVTFAPASTVLPHVQSGRLIELATTQLKRASVAPDLPTMSEAGLKGFDTGVWFGLLAPAGTPRDVVERLAQASNAALKSREVIDPLQKQGIDVLGGTPDEFADYISSEIAKWSRVAEAAGLKQ